MPPTYEEFTVTFDRPGTLGLQLSRPSPSSGTSTSSCAVNKVTSPIAASLGIQSGDEFTTVAGVSVLGMDMEQLQKLLGGKAKERPLLVGFRRVVEESRNKKGSRGGRKRGAAAGAAAGAPGVTSSSTSGAATAAAASSGAKKKATTSSTSAATPNKPAAAAAAAPAGRTRRNRAKKTGETLVVPPVDSAYSDMRKDPEAPSPKRRAKRDKTPTKKKKRKTSAAANNDGEGGEGSRSGTAAASASAASTAALGGGGARWDANLSVIERARAAAGYTVPAAPPPRIPAVAAARPPAAAAAPARDRNGKFASPPPLPTPPPPPLDLPPTPQQMPPIPAATAASEEARERARAAAGYKLPPSAQLLPPGASAAGNVGSGTAATAATGTANLPNQQQQQDDTIKSCPLLASMGVPLTLDARDADCRSRLMAELIAFNSRHSLKNEFITSNGKQTRLIKLPSKPYSKSHSSPGPRHHNDSSNANNANKSGCEKFYESCKRTRFVDEMLDGIATAHETTEDEAASYLMHYFAKKKPKALLKFTELAQSKLEKEEKKDRKKRETLVPPPDYQDFDGTGNVEWNCRYLDMIKYKAEHGDCLVPTHMAPLGGWVSAQRSYYKKKNPYLTERRIELLESIGFVWSVRPPKFGESGDPKFNAAFAARLHYSDLSVRETLLLGGYDDQTLEEVTNPKHSWRSTYVTLKDKMYAMEKRWAEIRSSNPRKVEIIKFWDMLRGRAPGGSIGVFGERATLLPQFLQAAALRKSQGIGRDGPKKRRGKTSTSAAPTRASVPAPTEAVAAAAPAAVAASASAPALEEAEEVPPPLPSMLQPGNAGLDEHGADREEHGEEEDAHFWTKRSRGTDVFVGASI